MSDSFPLKKIAELGWSCELDDVLSAILVLQKIAEAKEAIAQGHQKSGISQDQRTSDELREVRRFLDDTELDLNGPECVLLGSFFKHRENVELLDTRSLNVTLDSYSRKPSNTTSTVENLEKKGLIEFVAGEDLHAHKTFRLTDSGFHEASELMNRLSRQKLSVAG